MVTICSIIVYIDEYLGENICVEDFVDKCGMSYSFFVKSFYDFYGCLCKEYIELMCVIKVEDMLLFILYSFLWIV